MSNMRHALLGAVFLGLLALAAAQPCIECRNCRTQNCFSVCKRECPSAPVVVNGESCKRFGREKGARIGRDACSTALMYCRGGQRMVGSRRFPVTLSQCENIAYGTCQASARDSANWAGCRWAFDGYMQCTAQQFQDFFFGEVNDRCNQAVSVINP